MADREPCKHGNLVCSMCVIITDAAKRMSDTVNLHITCNGSPWELRNQWLAFRLADGTTDGALYDSKQAAVRHQPDYRLCAYFSFRAAMGGANPKDCQIFLDMHRHVYDNGGQVSDPDDPTGGPDLIMSSRGYDFFTGRRRPGRRPTLIPGIDY